MDLNDNINPHPDVYGGTGAGSVLLYQSVANCAQIGAD